jgi:hypothetical protein
MFFNIRAIPVVAGQAKSQQMNEAWSFEGNSAFFTIFHTHIN